MIVKQVKRSSDDSNILKAVAYNKNGQIINSKIGNFTLTKTYFPETNLLKTTSSTGIQSFEYSYDQLGNMVDRYDHLHTINNVSLHEHFTYDSRNQLKTIVKNDIPQCEMLYDGLGNITFKSDVGNSNYNTAGKPYQIAEIITNYQLKPDYKTAQNITYTDFNKVDSITSDQYLLKIKYGLGNERIIQQLYSKNGLSLTLLSQKTYVGGLSEITDYGDGSSKTVNYINSPEGLTAIEISSSTGSKEWYWVFTDHLGSITSLVRESDGQKFEMSFDAWGNRRDPATWVNYTTTLPDFIIDRGFTGHEHYDEFGLINMNGRVYDPVIARFLSPDSYVQAPELAQNYNGYVYCLNNPLKFKDPNGDFFLGTILTFIGDLYKTAYFDGGLDPTSRSARRKAWEDFDPTASWSPTNKAFKIDIGAFKTDPNRTDVGSGLQLLSRWTWERPQNIIGKWYSNISNMTGSVENVSYYGGATVVESSRSG